MDKKLAIKGHPTRGEEVIELLMIMGGNNIYNLSGNNTLGYYINDDRQNIIYSDKCTLCNKNYAIFTLEEFLEQYPFKVGDKVIYTKFGDNCNDNPVTIQSMKWTGTTIEYTFNNCITCLAKDLKMWNNEFEARIAGIPLNNSDYEDEVELILGDYEIEVRDGRTYAVLKKPKYPKTYEGCCDILKIPNEERYIDIDVPSNYNKLLIAFTKLLIRRDAYWKIAGEQMGLSKPWKPDFTDTTDKFIICCYQGEITFSTLTWAKRILAFPTEEMRDAFYENFKDLIEQCKELL